MDFSTISTVWCNLSKNSRILIISDKDRISVARKIMFDNERFVKEISIIELGTHEFKDAVRLLNEDDLLIVTLTIDSFINQNYKDVFPSFSKPKGVKSKYAFIRLDIPRRALISGLNTDVEKVEHIVSSLETLRNGVKVCVTSPSGTYIETKIKDQWVIPYIAQINGDSAFLPPAEVSEDLYDNSSNGIIVVDVTVGELRVNGILIDSLGIVDGLVYIEILNGRIVSVKGGDIGCRLKKGISALSIDDLCLVELGHGLSDIKEIGIIGVDESMNDTCHFGIGTGSPLHLDVVVRNPRITIID